MGPALYFAAAFGVLKFGRPADQRWNLTREHAAALGWISGMLLALVLLEEAAP